MYRSMSAYGLILACLSKVPSFSAFARSDSKLAPLRLKPALDFAQIGLPRCTSPCCKVSWFNLLAKFIKDGEAQAKGCDRLKSLESGLLQCLVGHCERHIIENDLDGYQLN